MKLFYRTKYSTVLLALISFGLLLLAVGSSSCTRYNPYTGRYEPDPGMTMIAVGTAALAGSIIYYDSTRHKYYHRPPHHYHYYRPPGPPHHRH